MTPVFHIYTAPLQPATRFKDTAGGGRPLVIRFSPFKRLLCRACGRLRIARNLHAQVFYDDLRFFCKDKTRCKPKRRKK